MTKFALDLSNFVEPGLGDEVICYGHGIIADVWRGYVSKRVIGSDKCTGNVAWSNNATICDGEFVVQAHQHEGMSGGAVANSCGYTGMAHTTHTDLKTTGFVGVIGAAVIRDFITQLRDLLSDATDCGIEVVSLPTSPFIDCSKVKSDSIRIADSDNILQF